MGCAEFAQTARVPVIGLLILFVPGVPSEAAKQKRRPPPAAAGLFPPAPPNRSSLTGEKIKLTWDDFTRRESPPSGQRKTSDIHSLAYTLASYQMSNSLQWTQQTARSPTDWRISAVNVDVKILTDRSWVRASVIPHRK